MGRTMGKVGVAPNERSRDIDGSHTFLALGVGMERSMFKREDPENWFW